MSHKTMSKEVRRKGRRHAGRTVHSLLFEENACALADLVQHYHVEHTDDSASQDFYEHPPALHNNSQVEEPTMSRNGSYHYLQSCNTVPRVQCLSKDDTEGETLGFEMEVESVCDNSVSLIPSVSVEDNAIGPEYNGGNDYSSSDSDSVLGGLANQEEVETSCVPSFSLHSSDISPEALQILKGETGEKCGAEELKRQLAVWASKYLVKRNAVDELLHILRGHGHSELPACAKTLLNTPRSTTSLVKTLAGGQFWYRGIVNGLKTRLNESFDRLTENGSIVTIDIFVDGISPHGSVKRNMWPIAGCIVNEKKPFVIALWCGSTKEPTSVDEYLQDFEQEASRLFENGFKYKGISFTFRIRNFHADAPARAWLRKVKPHNSYHSCERCTHPGEWRFNRMTYNPAYEATLRTDETFQNQLDKEYHKGVSSLLQLGVKMISQFPLDIMHMVYLGVSRRLYAILLKKKAGKFKLPDRDVERLDRLCHLLAPFCPSDFARKPRPLSQYKLFKATEFRRLLLYDGFILHKNHKHKEVYECYLLLACAMRILLDSNIRTQFHSDAHELLVTFVKKSYRLLGSWFVVYNVHHLLHLVADCLLHGDPEGFSCFKYETHLGQLKNFLSAPGRTLQQIMCRLIERSLIQDSTPATHPTTRQCFEPHNNGPLLNDCVGKQFAHANVLGSTIRTAVASPRDSCVLTSAGSVVVVENIVENDCGTYFIGRKFLNKQDYFQYPVSSSVLKIFKVSELSPLKKYNIEVVSRKVVLYPLSMEQSEDENFNWRDGHLLCIPLLHSEQ